MKRAKKDGWKEVEAKVLREFGVGEREDGERVFEDNGSAISPVFANALDTITLTRAALAECEAKCKALRATRLYEAYEGAKVVPPTIKRDRLALAFMVPATLAWLCVFAWFMYFGWRERFVETCLVIGSTALAGIGFLLSVKSRRHVIGER